MHSVLPIRWPPWAWPWPLPAVVGWLAAWAAFFALQPLLGVAVAGSAAMAAGAVCAWPLSGAWRRAIAGLGFPASALAAGWAGGVPAWTWLLPLLALAGAYPLRAWRDAPFFPTPAGALDALAGELPLAPGAHVLDAGCGLGHALHAIRRAWPQARVEGVEWSWPLALVARLRCPWARVRRGDMWGASWRDAALVYVFQRPESMARVWAKACAEMAPGSWLVSLEFIVPDRPPDLSHGAAGGRVVHAWRVPEGGVAPARPRGGRRTTLNRGAGAPITTGNAPAPSARA